MKKEEQAKIDIKNIKMSAEESERVFNNILSIPIHQSFPRPVKSPFSFASILWNNSFAFYAAILCLIILGGGLITISNQNKKQTEIATNYQMPTVEQNIENTQDKVAYDKDINESKTGNAPMPPTMFSKITTPTTSTDNTKAPSNTAPARTATMINLEKDTSEITSGLLVAYKNYKNGQISECTEEGKIYYSGTMNTYDGGGHTFDVKGNVVGKYQGFTGKYTGVAPQNCERIYVVYPNIWGYPAINKYNLK